MAKTERRVVNLKQSTWELVQAYATKHKLIFVSFDEVLQRLLEDNEMAYTSLGGAGENPMDNA